MGTVTWIKNNEIETKNSLSFFLSNQGKTIYDKKSVPRGRKVCIKDDIEVLHFKKCNFLSYTIFECLNKDTVLIFEDCKFGHAEFINGSIRMEQPNNIDPKAYYKVIKFYNNKNVELVLADNNISLSSNNLHVLSDVANLYVTGDASKTMISTTSVLDAFSVKNAQDLSLDVVQATNMEIKDSTIKKGDIFSYKNLKIVNSEIKGFSNFLILDGKKIEMENLTIKAKKFNMQGSIYQPKDGVLTFTSTEETKGNAALAQTNFISVLKAIDQQAHIGAKKQQEKIRTSIEQKHQSTIETLKEETLEARKNMEYYAAILMERQMALNNIEQQQACAMQNVEHQLTKQKIKKLVTSKQ